MVMSTYQSNPQALSGLVRSVLVCFFRTGFSLCSVPKNSDTDCAFVSSSTNSSVTVKTHKTRKTNESMKPFFALSLRLQTFLTYYETLYSPLISTPLNSVHIFTLSLSFDLFFKLSLLSITFVCLFRYGKKAFFKPDLSRRELIDESRPASFLPRHDEARNLCLANRSNQ